MLWKVDKNRTNPEKPLKNPGRDVRKAEQLIHSSILWLQNQMVAFNLKRHGNSGKSLSNNNEQRQHIPGCVLHSEMLCYRWDGWNANLMPVLVSPTFDSLSFSSLGLLLFSLFLYFPSCFKTKRRNEVWMTTGRLGFFTNIDNMEILWGGFKVQHDF